MSVYRRGGVWWYKFRFAGQVIRESSKSESKTIAKDGERARRRELEESFNRISRPRTAQLFSVAAETWLKGKVAHLSPRSVIIERANLKHIIPFWGKILLCDITAEDIARYQADRLGEGSREQFAGVMSLDRELWLKEIALHDELFTKLADRLPSEMISMRDLLISSLERTPELGLAAAAPEPETVKSVSKAE